MQEWFFFLLPVAALSGWLIARKHYKNKYKHRDAPFDPAYFKGLNYLLNEQPDKAIDVFVSLLEVDSETVETHMALANLFRRRGETERAIRIHQNLIARPSLTSQQRTQALVELGQDYMSAGVLDRAEQLFTDLLQHNHPPIEAPRHLLRIYQQEKNWLKAIQMAQLIPNDSKTNTRVLSAQFYCELAVLEFDRNKTQALNYIRKAYQFDKKCARASLLEGKLLIRENQYKKALRVLETVEQQNPDYLPEALPLLHSCYQQTNSLHDFREWLEQLLKRQPHMTSARLLLTKVIRHLRGEQAAQFYLYRELHKHPSVEGLHQLITLNEGNQQVLIPLIREVTTTLLHKGDRYTCKNCGFSGRTMHWQCPGCHQWATVRPVEIHLSSLEKLLESSS